MSTLSKLLHWLGNATHKVVTHLPASTQAAVRAAGDALHQAAVETAVAEAAGHTGPVGPLAGAIVGGLVESAFETAGAKPIDPGAGSSAGDGATTTGASG